MRLSHIKLAGFKSFVDPAHIPVPGGLVGVVGPNGCGKSNVIDAVRWVLGESSAKHLRGETMQDVIFNGSGERKPANRASVELVFDNSLGKAGGPWASYVEISVKRVLERDGESAYFINNQHVRRRDVADIFLGTGLGGRAYAIIEQGMISRVVDARPEELRTFLEEAASISRYRERRKETEQRLEDTRENLARVDDILLELDQRLEHLERQAEVARRYRALEDQLRSAQQLLWLLRKQEATNQRQRVSRELEQLAVDLEADTARLRALESEIAHLRTAHFASSDLMHAAQGAMYESNAGVARLEQSLQHQRESRSRVEAQKASLVREREEAARQADIARGNLGDQTSNLAQAAERLNALHAQEHMLKADLPAAESEFAATRAELDRLSQELVRSQQEQQVERMRQDHAQRLLGQLAQRRERLSQEETALLDVDAAELERLGLDLAELDTRQRDQRTALEVAEAAAATYELGHRQQVEEADVVARDLASLEARLSALQLLQRQVSRSGEMHAWLDNHELDALGRLWQGIRIEPGWEDALEAVLRERLNAIALADLHTAAAWIEGPPPGKISFFVREQSLPQPPAAPFTPLAQYVTCRDAGLTAVLVDWLSEVYVAAEALEGFARRGELPEGAVLVCPEGHLFTRHSVSFHAADSEIHGILSRQREIDSLQLQQGDLADRVTRTRDAANSARVQLEAQREEVQRLRKRAEEVQQARHDLQLDQVRLSQQGERVAHRRAQIADEAAELAAEVQREEQVHHAAGARLTTLDGLLTDLGQRVAEAQVSHQGAGERLSQRRDELQAALRRSQESEFGHREIVNNINNLTHILQELDEKERRLAAQLETLGLELAQLDEASLRAELDAALEVRAAREQALVRARSGLEEAERGLKEAEQQRMLCEQRLAPLRDRMGELRLKEQETRLSEEGFAAQLAEAGADEGALAERLEKGTRPGSLQADIHRYTEEMTSLGAVNLAALDELSTGQERKAYLEAQSADLHEAVATLETAIRRIDRETRERLQTTFDEVNRNLAELFPLLFGGGEARLVMSGEEILDAGVSIVARPPGKRNASIHLLSGGEKALTALALVFSLFQLNPAPFCLLDEVDAPLDDSNTERFCALVKKMAAQTQFVFISHNKITMELAEQLVGVTMAEQGVSKVVAVDIEEALKFREEAAA